MAENKRLLTDEEKAKCVVVARGQVMISASMDKACEVQDAKTARIVRADTIREVFKKLGMVSECNLCGGKEYIKRVEAKLLGEGK